MFFFFYLYWDIDVLLIFFAGQPNITLVFWGLCRIILFVFENVNVIIVCVCVCLLSENSCCDKPKNTTDVVMFSVRP